MSGNGNGGQPSRGSGNSLGGDMRQIYSKFESVENTDISSFSNITDLTSTIEKEALTQTLSKLQLEISVNQQVGAVYKNISEKVTIKNLQDLVFKNERGLYEFKLDSKNMLMLGSLDSVKP